MELSPSTFDDLRRLIHRISGIVISDDKEYLIRHRLEPLVQSSGCRSFDEFKEKLSSPVEMQLQEAIIEAITTQETSFFRDSHPFEALRRHVLPELIRTAHAAKIKTGLSRIRIWCSGVATGQEAYSLAFLISEYLDMHREASMGEREFSIVATDISAKALATAAAGKYERREVERGLTPNQVQRFFDQQGDHWVVRSALRQMLEFRRLNLVQTVAHLGAFDAILCRNVLIYFDEATRRRLCEQFHEMLPEGGWLILGSAENLYGINAKFQSLRFGDTLLFRKLVAGT
jgi:chemotaxis protein methyltransferase CheR